MAWPSAPGTVLALGDPRLECGRREALHLLSRSERRIRRSGDPRASPYTRQIKPNYRVLYSYGAVQAWAAAVVRVGSLDIQTVGAALRNREFEAVLGRIRFDDKGDVIPAGFKWFVWTDGEFVSKDVGKSGAAMRSGKRPE